MCFYLNIPRKNSRVLAPLALLNVETTLSIAKGRGKKMVSINEVMQVLHFCLEELTVIGSNE